MYVNNIYIYISLLYIYWWKQKYLHIYIYTCKYLQIHIYIYKYLKGFIYIYITDGGRRSLRRCVRQASGAAPDVTLVGSLNSLYIHTESQATILSAN